MSNKSVGVLPNVELVPYHHGQATTSEIADP